MKKRKTKIAMKFMKSNRAQMTDQIFVFVLALIIFGGVLIYGYKAIFSIKEGVEDASFVSFYESLKTKSEQVRIDYGSVKKFSAMPPQGFKELCFIDAETLRQKPELFSDLQSEHPLIADAVEGGTDQNMFFEPLAKTSTKIAVLRIEKGYECFLIEDREIHLRLQGLGDKLGLSAWEK